MAIKVNFIDTNVLYYSADLNRQFNSIINKNGLLRENSDFLVTQTSPASMQVIVGKGSAFMDGMYIYSDLEVKIDIPRNEEDDDRTDSIILRVDPVSGDCDVVHLLGDIDKAPEIKDYELKICDILVPKVVSTGNIAVTKDRILMTDDYVFLSKAEIEEIVDSI